MPGCGCASADCVACMLVGPERAMANSVLASRIRAGTILSIAAFLRADAWFSLALLIGLLSRPLERRCCAGLGGAYVEEGEAEGSGE